MPFQRCGGGVVKKISAIEQLLQNNHKHGSIPKDFNNNTDTSKSAPSKAIISGHKPKLNSVRFEDSCDHINHVYNTNYYNYPVDVRGYDNRVDAEEK